MLDFSSLLLAAALSGTCLSVVMLIIWITNRQVGYIITMSGGTAVLVAHVVAFWQYSQHPSPWLCQVVLALLTLGFYIIYAATAQYVGRRNHVRVSLPPVLATMALAAVLVFVKLDGVAFIVSYTAVVALLLLGGAAFWQNRYETRGVLLATSLLSGVCAISFGLCALVLLFQAQWTLGVAPDNWAERLNSVVAVACMTGLGALTLSLHHVQAAVQLRAEAATDPLTGLMNRRALQALHGDSVFGPFTAIVMFDLDHFKKTNDVFGHQVGDEVLKRFAAMVRKHARNGDEAFRLGGEEFALVMQRVSDEKAYDVASRICMAFGSEVVPTKLGPLRSTVSAGIGAGNQSGLSLDDMLDHSDAALYQAKRTGRNRVAREELRMAG